jgi:hypothetical protein
MWTVVPSIRCWMDGVRLDMVVATICFSSMPAHVPPEAFALQKCAQVSLDAEPFFPLLMSEDVFLEVQP